MLITISVPDNTVGIFYSTKESSEDYSYSRESEPEKITYDMIVKVEQE